MSWDDSDSLREVDDTGDHGLRFLDEYESEDEDPNAPAIFPLMSTFIRFSIDPIEMTKAVEDEEVQAAARAMVTKEYLGYVHRLRSLDTTQPYLIHDIVLIGRGTPARNEQEGVEPDMCTPIFPATAHPAGRKPLQTNKPFPFENCYTHTHVPTARVRIKTEWAPYANAFALPSMEHIRDGALAIQDQDRMDELRQGMSQGLLGSSNLVDCPADEMRSGLGGGGDGGEMGEYQDEEDGDLDLDIPNVMAAIMEQGVPDESMTAVTNVSYDLSGLEGFSQPEEFFEEEAYLQKLIRDSKAKAIKRAQRVDEGTYGESSKFPAKIENREAGEREVLGSLEGEMRAGRLKRVERSLSNGWNRFRSWVLSGPGARP